VTESRLVHLFSWLVLGALFGTFYAAGPLDEAPYIVLMVIIWAAACLITFGGIIPTWQEMETHRHGNDPDFMFGEMHRWRR